MQKLSIVVGFLRAMQILGCLAATHVVFHASGVTLNVLVVLSWAEPHASAGGGEEERAGGGGREGRVASTQGRRGVVVGLGLSVAAVQCARARVPLKPLSASSLPKHQHQPPPAAVSAESSRTGRCMSPASVACRRSART